VALSEEPTRWFRHSRRKQENRTGLEFSAAHWEARSDRVFVAPICTRQLNLLGPKPMDLNSGERAGTMMLIAQDGVAA